MGIPGELSERALGILEGASSEKRAGITMQEDIVVASEGWGCDPVIL